MFEIKKEGWKLTAVSMVVTALLIAFVIQSAYAVWVPPKYDLSIDKRVESVEDLTIGDNITYYFYITNYGPYGAKNVEVHDDHCKPKLVEKLIDDGDKYFEKGEVWVYRCEYTIESYGEIKNTAIVTATNWNYSSTLLDINQTNNTDTEIVVITPPTATVQGYVYEDPERNNIYTPEKKGVKGVEVNLISSDNSAMSTTTDDDGFYKFNNVPLGEYYVQYNESDLGYLEAQADDDTAIGGSLPDIITSENFTLVSGQTKQHNFSVIANPNIDVIKTANKTYLLLNQDVQFDIEVKNNAKIDMKVLNVTDILPECLEFVTADPYPDEINDAIIWNFARILSPGESFNITLIAKAIKSGNCVNNVYVNATNLTWGDSESDDPVEIQVISPDISVEKYVSTDNSTWKESVTVYEGSTVYWKVVVTNTGDVELSVTLIDNNGLNENFNLTPSESRTFYYSTTPHSDVNNIATATGYYETGYVQDRDNASVTVTEKVCEFTDLGVKKMAIRNGQQVNKVKVGDVITFRINVTNYGGSNVSELEITDTLCNPYLVDKGDGDEWLNVSETWVYECKYTATREDGRWINNSVFVLSPYADTNIHNNTDSVSVEVEDYDYCACELPDLFVEKTCYHETGKNVFVINVTNYGAPAENVIVVESIKCDDGTGPDKIVGDLDDYLEMGEVWQYKCIDYGPKYCEEQPNVLGWDFISPECVDNYECENMVFVMNSNGDSNIFNNTAHCKIEREKLNVIKTANVTSAEVGDTIEYTIKVTNKGTTSIAGNRIIVVDSLQGTLTNPDSRLDPGETWTYVYNYTVTEDDCSECGSSTLKNTVKVKVDGNTVSRDSFKVTLNCGGCCGDQETAWAIPTGGFHEFGPGWGGWFNYICGDEMTVPLIAGQHHQVGNLIITTDGNDITVEYDMSSAHLIETHLYVDTEPPQTNAPGRFPYKHELDCTDTDTYVIEDLCNGGGNLYISAHASVVMSE